MILKDALVPKNEVSLEHPPGTYAATAAPERSTVAIERQHGQPGGQGRRTRQRPAARLVISARAQTFHFRTSVARGLEIVQGLRGHITGYAVPTYVIDAPGGGGKIPLYPSALVRRDGDTLVLKNYEGHLYQYPDPSATRRVPVEPAHG